MKQYNVYTLEYSENESYNRLNSYMSPISSCSDDGHGDVEVKKKKHKHEKLSMKRRVNETSDDSCRERHYHRHKNKSDHEQELIESRVNKKGHSSHNDAFNRRSRKNRTSTSPFDQENKYREGNSQKSRSYHHECEYFDNSPQDKDYDMRERRKEHKNKRRRHNYEKRKKQSNPRTYSPDPLSDTEVAHHQSGSRKVKVTREGSHEDQVVCSREIHPASKWEDEPESEDGLKVMIKEEVDSDTEPPRPKKEKKGKTKEKKDKNENDWGKSDASVKEESKEKEEKQKPTMALSGKLAEDTNTYKGIVIKYSQPPEARKPKRRWRWYIFKGDDELPFLPLHRHSAFLIGRDRKVVDIPTDHPSCSKQHAVLQYRLVEYEKSSGVKGRTVKPFIIDLESANGTYVNNKRIDPKRYVELLERDVVKFGYSTREYVLLHEQSKDENGELPTVSDDEPELSPISLLRKAD